MSAWQGCDYLEKIDLIIKNPCYDNRLFEKKNPLSMYLKRYINIRTKIFKLTINQIKQ